MNWMKTLLLAVISAFALQSHAVEIKITIEGMADTTLVLANHYGEKQYVKDTFEINSKGVASMKVEDLPRGIYMAVLPELNNTYFEFLVADEKKIELKTKKDDLVESMQVLASEENKIFYESLKFINARGARMGQLKKSLEGFEDKNSKEAKQITEEMRTLHGEIKQQRLDLVENHPNSFYAQILNAMREIDVPDAPETIKEERDQQLWQYNYYKGNYWQNFNFKETGLAYTPIYHSKLKEYFTKVMPQHPDSLKIYVDKTLQLAKQDEELFKFGLVYFFNESVKSKVMGMDALYVFLAQNYYLDGAAPWMDTAQLIKMEDRVGIIQNLLIGKRAPDIKLKNLAFEPQPLYSVQSKYTLVFMWDPTCGHCKKSTPKLRDLYNDTLKEMGLTVYSIGTTEYEKWKVFLDEKDLPKDWIHVYPYQPKDHIFRDHYDVKSTPVVFLLDADKKIIAKRLGVEQLPDFITNYEKMMKQLEAN